MPAHTPPTSSPQPRMPVRRKRVQGSLTVLELRDDLSRVTRRDGAIVGYIDRLETADTPTYRARRYVPTERRFVELPPVRSSEDAVDSLR